jgi:hypothetical protein
MGIFSRNTVQVLTQNAQQCVELLREIARLWPRNEAGVEIASVKTRLTDDFDRIQFLNPVRGDIKIIQAIECNGEAVGIHFLDRKGCLNRAVFRRVGASWLLGKLEFQCPVCFGTGINDDIECFICGGSGWGAR